ncbi:hypothetical protein PBY51_006420 [Eleginops maclovinus]|uniref:Uncharacterized protein n=1 Tax=Eleginops maclovinus TaxID=56733 RepID=A0AAN8AF14_ELEMC|nr:hypothetical protein PBY51_006420 [Eleginops maclovinus]
MTAANEKPAEGTGVYFCLFLSMDREGGGVARVDGDPRGPADGGRLSGGAVLTDLANTAQQQQPGRGVTDI